MLMNNIELDVKTKCIEEDVTQAKLAELAGTSPSYVCRLIGSGDKVINKTFLKMMDSLGYDVCISYVKKENGGE